MNALWDTTLLSAVYLAVVSPRLVEMMARRGKVLHYTRHSRLLAKHQVYDPQ